jgi:hypothetical protein
MNLTTLPNDLLALVIVKLDRYSLSALVLSCKIIYNRSFNKDLLSMVASKKRGLVPGSPLLVLHDYCLMKPREFIPITINNEEKLFKFDSDLNGIIASYFGRYEYIRIRIEIILNQQIKHVYLICGIDEEQILKIFDDSVSVLVTDSLNQIDNIISVSKYNLSNNICDWLPVILKEPCLVLSMVVNDIRPN